MSEVPDMRVADYHWDSYIALLIESHIAWYAGNKAYSRQMALDAMGHLDACYEELGVEMTHD